MRTSLIELRNSILSVMSVLKCYVAMLYLDTHVLAHLSAISLRSFKICFIST